MDETYEVTVGPEGRVLIPAGMRRASGIEPGSTVVVRLEGDRVVLTSHSAIKRRLQRMFAEQDGSMAEELISERRAEVKKEAMGE